MITVWYFLWLWPNHLKLFLYPNSVKFGSWRTGIHYGHRLDSSRIQVFFLFCDSFKCLTYLPSHLLNCNPGQNTLVALQASNNEHFINIPVFLRLDVSQPVQSFTFFRYCWYYWHLFHTTHVEISCKKISIFWTKFHSNGLKLFWMTSTTYLR